MIKAICFDLDGVYFTADSFKDFKLSLPKTENDEDTVSYVLSKSDEMMDFKSGKMTEEAFWKYAREKLGITVSNEEIFKTLRDSYEVNPKVRDYVKKVRAAGYKTCVCTNNFVTRIRELDAKFNFLSDFDIKILSYEVGYIKPWKEIFQALINESGVLPEEIFYSDDTEQKMAGARELGIQTFLYTDVKSFIDQLEYLGVKV